MKGISIPPPRRAFGWDAMRVGDCRTLPYADRHRVFQAASHYKRRHEGWNYTTRVIGETLQLWRTS